MLESLGTLVERARGGDSQAFERIVVRFRDNAHARAYSMTRDYHLAQDIVQEAFTEAYLSLDKLREPAAFPGWFRRIVIKRGDRLIRGKRLPTTSLDEGLRMASRVASTDERMDADEAGDFLHDAVCTLPEHERDVAHEYYFEGESQKDIAAVHGVPVTTIKKRLYASRQRLKHDVSFLGAGEALDRAPFSKISQLFSAAWHGYGAKAQELLDANPALVSARNEDGLSILLWAAHASHHSGNAVVAELLIARNAEIDLFAAAALGARDRVVLELRKGLVSINARGAWGRSVVHWAASGGHDGTVEWLLRHGANVNDSDEWGCTPLHLAAELGHFSTVKLLLGQGADVHARLKNGKSPLHVAAQSGMYSVVEELLRHGAVLDVFVATSVGWEERVAKMLSREPGLANVRLPYGATPLHVAAENHQQGMAEFLVENGAELDIVSAAELGWHDEVVELLETSPRAVNMKSGSFGFTALHSATAKGRRNLARLLLSRGAEVNATDDMYRKTPLGEAMYYGNEAMAQLLCQFGARA